MVIIAAEVLTLKGERSTQQLSGKTFYIILLVCVMVVGGSAYLLLSMGGSDDDLTLKDPKVTPWTFPSIAPTVMPTQRLDAPVTATVPAAPTLPPTPAPTAAPTQKPAATPKPTVKPASEDTGDGGHAVSSGSFFVKPVDVALPTVYEDDELSYNATLGEWRFHGGLDIVAEPGTDVVAVADGEVAKVDYDLLLGNLVVLKHSDGLTSVYANLADEINVTAGDKVQAGDELGTVGATAAGEVVQASHLHFELKKDGAFVDPLKYLPKS